MQRPLYYTGFGVATLNLETFTQVSVTSTHRKLVNLHHHFLKHQNFNIFSAFENRLLILHDIQNFNTLNDHWYYTN